MGVLPLFRSLFADFLVRPALMRRERDQAAISPGLSFSKFIGGQTSAPLRFDRVHDRPLPIDTPLRGREDVGVDALIALGVVAYSPGRVEFDGLEWPHERPAKG